MIPLNVRRHQRVPLTKRPTDAEFMRTCRCCSCASTSYTNLERPRFTHFVEEFLHSCLYGGKASQVHDKSMRFVAGKLEEFIAHELYCTLASSSDIDPPVVTQELLRTGY